MKTTLGYGSTNPGATAWKKYGSKAGDALYVDVNTSSAGFSQTPMYFTSLEGNSQHWTAQGVNAIYEATATGFRVYIRRSDPSVSTPFTPTKANELQWHIRWMGVHGETVLRPAFEERIRVLSEPSPVLSRRQ